MSQLADIEVHPMRWRLRLSHGVNQEILSMAIISQDAIKLGCSGGQGKIQIQTLFVLGTPPWRACFPACSTIVESSLQIGSFMQNKPNFQKSQMNVSIFSIMDYENKSNRTLGENKPKTKPNKANFRKAKMNANVFVTKDYRKNAAFAVQKNKPKTKPISEKPKMNVSSILTKNYENKRLRRRGENKPNLSTGFGRLTTSPLRTGQTRSEAEIPTGELLGILKPGTKQTKCTLSELFLFFTFLCPGYNLAMQTWTIQKLLNWVTEYLTNKNVDSPRLSAELLLSHVLKMKRIELYTQFDKPVPKQGLDRLHDLVKRAGQHEPIAYLTGKTEFYSLEMNITPDCMVPRPETELLVERAIEFLWARPVRNSTMFKTTQKEEISKGASTGTQFVCDLCTGCGCIAVAIAKNFPDARIIATDISDTALNVAAINVEKHQLTKRITLLLGDLFDPIVPKLDFEKLVPDYDRGFDLIVCNPPYVSSAEFEKLDKNVKDYEPRPALLAGNDGLDIYRKIFEKVDKFLKPDAALMLEIGFTQGQAIKELLEKAGAFAEIKIEKDLHKNDRIVTAIKTSS